MSNNRIDSYREIITKAICGKGKKFTQAAHSVTPVHKPTSILGCWVINHKYKTRYQKDCVNVDGSYELNIWYSYNGNTKTEVVTETVTYSDEIPLTVRDKRAINDDREVITRVLQEPNSLEANISPNGNKIVAQVERELLVEVVGETTVKVQVDEEEFIVEDDWEDELEDSLEDLDSDFLIGETEE